MTIFRSPSEVIFLDLIGDIYDCAIEPSLWPRTLERLAGLVDGAEAAITLHDTARPSFAIQMEWNINREFAGVMQEHLPQNPFPIAAWYADVGEPFSAFDHYGEVELKRGQWFKSTLGRFGYGDVALTLLVRSASQFGGLSIHRMEHQPNFGDGDLSVLRLLAPHIRRAVKIADLLDAGALERDMLSATLEMLSVGIIMTDETARIVHANHAAERLLSHAGALLRDGDRLSTRDSRAAFDLRQAVAEAARGSTISMPRSGIAVTVGDLAVWALPLDGGLRSELGGAFAAKAVLFIRELGDTRPFPAELFVRRYGITPAECRLLVLLAQGMTIAEAAETQGIALSTAKTHLARLFQKTGTERQAELVRLTMSAFAPAAVS